MDNSKNKAARKVRELTSHLEEEDLWDLEDSWDDDDGETSETSGATEAADEGETAAEKTETPEPVEKKEETGDLFDLTEQEPEDETGEMETPDDKSAAPDEDDASELAGEIPEDASEEAPEEIPGETAEAPKQADAVQDTFDDPDLTPEEAARKSAAELIKKTGLSTVEKIALAAVALMFAGLAIWGYMFLHEHNRLGNAAVELDLPIEGKHATVSGFKTFWQSPGDESGVRLGTQVVPAAEITLSDDSSGSGAFRLYFLNTENNRVGDPITIVFEGGKFANGEKSIEVSASDGFHQEGDFNAYVLDRALAWRVQLLEAGSASASGADFEQVLETVVEPVRK